MKNKKVIGILAGSLRKESFPKKLGKAVVSMAPEGYEFRMISLEDLPVYNQDFDDHDQVPDSYVAFRKEIAAMDGFIFITPEHNRSIPAVLKNAVDIASRPRGKNLWSGKPGAVFSNSPGPLSAFGAHHHLRQVLVCLNVHVQAQPEVYLAKIGEAFEENGDLNTSVKGFVQKAVDAFVSWVERLG